MNDPRRSRLPFTTDAFAILVAVSAGEQTGSEIQKRVVGDGVGLYISPSSVYTVLHRFAEMGLVVEDARYYKLSDAGWKRLEAETRTLGSLTEQARRRVVASGRGRW